MNTFLTTVVAILVNEYTAGGVITIGIIVLIIISANPDKIEKWMNIFAKFKPRADAFRTKYEIQSKINSFATDMAEMTDSKPAKIHLKWASSNKDTDDIHLEDGSVILVMRDRGYKNKNFVHASIFYTSNILLKETKRHISQKQAKALDLYTAHKLIEKQGKDAMHIFMSDFLNEHLKDKKIKDLFTKFMTIDATGYYTHILLKELRYLGIKQFLTANKRLITKEVNDLILFLEAFAGREVGDMTTKDTFIGEYTRCSIKIVSSVMTRLGQKHSVPIQKILETFNVGVENVYVIGPAKDSEATEFIQEVCKDVCTQNSGIIIIEQKTFSGQIKKDGKKQNTKTYYVHLNKSEEEANNLIIR